MRTRKTSSGDRTGDPYIYLHGVHKDDRVRLQGLIIRLDPIPCHDHNEGTAHRHVLLIQDNEVIFHGKQ